MSRIQERHLTRLMRRKAKKGEDVTPQQAEYVKAMLSKKHAPQFKILFKRTRALSDYKGFAATGDHPIMEWLAAHWKEILEIIMQLLASFMGPKPPATDATSEGDGGDEDDHPDEVEEEEEVEE